MVSGDVGAIRYDTAVELSFGQDARIFPDDRIMNETVRADGGTCADGGGAGDARGWCDGRCGMNPRAGGALRRKELMRFEVGVAISEVVP